MSKRALDINPANARYWQIHANALLALQRAQEAMAVLQKSLTLHPGEPALLLEIARLQARLGLKDMARENLRLALKQEPNLQAALDLMDGLKE